MGLARRVVRHDGGELGKPLRLLDGPARGLLYRRQAERLYSGCLYRLHLWGAAPFGLPERRSRNYQTCYLGVRQYLAVSIVFSQLLYDLCLDVVGIRYIVR